MRNSACLLVSCLVAAVAVGAGDTLKYRGDWFAVRYPSSFTVRKGSKDSAFFKAPGGAVEFYVFSPLWNGEPTDYAFDQKKEKYVDRSDETVKKNGETIRMRMATVRAQDGSYERSWLDRESLTYNTRLVFGIRYRDKKAYSANKAKYMAFKESLQQFSD